MKRSDDERLRNIPWVREMRADTIEECARVIDDVAKAHTKRNAVPLIYAAAAIRALKDTK